MTNRESIMLEEAEFPARFAQCERTSFGVMYHMDDNHDSYDGNHAFLYPERTKDLGAALDEIASFYTARGINPSLYHPHEEGYFERNREALISHGFSDISVENHRVMLLTDENRLPASNRLDIRLISEWDERIATDILIPSGEPWEVLPTKRAFDKAGSLVYVGYIGSRAAVYTNIHVSRHGNTRFDYIVAAKELRGQGCASELLSYVVTDCKRRGLPLCWQWAGPSESICVKAGFREAFTIPGGYASFPKR